MGKNFSLVIQENRKQAYKQGHLDATRKMMSLHAMAYCIAMNEVLGIGADRFAKVIDREMGIISNDFLSDPELCEIRLRRRFKEITGEDIRDVMVHV